MVAYPRMALHLRMVRDLITPVVPPLTRMRWTPALCSPRCWDSCNLAI